MCCDRSELVCDQKVSQSTRLDKSSLKNMKKKPSEKPYKNQYLIYTRKSTDDAENQKNSLSYQKAEAVRYAKRERLPVAKIDV